LQAPLKQSQITLKAAKPEECRPIPSIDLENKKVTLLSEKSKHVGDLVKGPGGFAMATFEEASLDFHTDIPNLLLLQEPKPAQKVTKKPAMHKRPATAEASVVAKAETEGGKDLPSTLGMVYFSSEDSDSAYEGGEGHAEEGGEEETPKETDSTEEDPAAQAVEPAKEAPKSEVKETPESDEFSKGVGKVGRKYTHMHYKKQNTMGVRRTWLEQGYKAPRQIFTFGHPDVPHSEDGVTGLKSIAKQVVAKLAEGMSENGAEKLGKDEARKLAERLS
jgi:hypothetical protein